MLFLTLTETLKFKVEFEIVNEALFAQRAIRDGSLNSTAFIRTVLAVVKFALLGHSIEIGKTRFKAIRVRPHVDFSDPRIIDQHAAATEAKKLASRRGVRAFARDGIDIGRPEPFLPDELINQGRLSHST